MNEIISLKCLLKYGSDAPLVLVKDIKIDWISKCMLKIVKTG